MLRISAAAIVLLLLPVPPVAAQSIVRQDWGASSKGEKVDIYTLKGEGGLEARITNFGGVIVNLWVPDRKGDKADIVLGYDDLAAYETGGVYGAIIGRVVNRIGSNASFTLAARSTRSSIRKASSGFCIPGPTVSRSGCGRRCLMTGRSPASLSVW
jgi:hypothetical protein